MSIWLRLLGFALCWVFIVAVLWPLIMKFPGRSVNTGMPDSGCFGWVASFVALFSFFILCAKGKPDEPGK